MVCQYLLASSLVDSDIAKNGHVSLLRNPKCDEIKTNDKTSRTGIYIDLHVYIPLTFTNFLSGIRAIILSVYSGLHLLTLSWVRDRLN